jgi:tRNA pseudouridine65 synthase
LGEFSGKLLFWEVGDLTLKSETGRQHQLRRHCKHMAHAIVGDATHGKGTINRAVVQLLGLNRLWLLATELTLQHPLTAPCCTFKPSQNPIGRYGRLMRRYK